VSQAIGEEDAMARVSTQVRLDGPIERVFDIVTTPAYWPRWHPATIGVSGMTERPVALGDVVRERAQIGSRLYEGNWTVVEHARPTRVVLRMEGGRLTIAYAFAPDGPATSFARELTYEPADFLGSAGDPAALERLMQQQSEVALRALKRLVEELLATSEGGSSS
jgi:uncharacterized protein YndB with AHSA1/START domain